MLRKNYSSLRKVNPTRRALPVALVICLMSAGIYATHAVYSRPLASALFIGNASVIEGDGAGTVGLTFTVTLSPADNAQAVTVDFRTSTTAENINTFGSSGAATASPGAGADYVSQSGTLTFNPGETSKPVTITVNSDCLPENAEFLRVLLSNPTNASIGNDNGQGQIITDDQHSLGIGHTSVIEGDSGTTILTFTVLLSGSPVTAQSVAACGPVTVDFRTSTTAENINTFGLNGAATASPDAGADYISQSGTLTFNAGETSKPINITVNPDCLPENDETLRALLSNATNAIIGNDNAQGQIVSDDQHSVSINNTSVMESANGTGTLTFTVSLSGSPVTAQSIAACGPVTVDFRTSTTAENINSFGLNGAATASPDAGADYVSQSGTLTFNPGETSKPINITINPDCLPENDETLRLLLSNVTNASLSNTSGQGSIQNNSTACLQVTNTNDTGAGSLRQALENANTNSDVNVINFQFPGAGPFTIKPSSPLPALFNPVVIDGYLQSGSAPNTDAQGNNAALLVELDGTDAGPGANGFIINANGCILRGLVINRFAQNGIALQSGNNSLIEGNFIGTDITGTANRGNGQHGIAINNATNAVIGGQTLATRNLIAFNGQAGIFVSVGVNDQIRRNNIFGNGGLGIDLAPAGFTANDPGDPDAGADNLQNYPIIAAVVRVTGATPSTTVNGTLNSTANQTFAVEFFNNPSCDPLNNGEGQTYLGTANVTTDGGGNANFTVVLPTTPPGTIITATATDPMGNTSEFSSCNLPTAAPAGVHGQVTTSDGLPLGGVTVDLNGNAIGRTITDNNGLYYFEDIEAGGFYIVTPSRANYAFTPPSRSFSAAGSETAAVFTAVAGEVTANPLDSTEFFVRQHYLDFLNREPEQAGFAYWSDRLNQCGGDQTCIRNRRIDLSNAFFFGLEFQQTGAYVFRLHRAAFGNSQPFPNPDPLNPAEARKLPSYDVFKADRARVVGGGQLAASQLELANLLVQRAEFLAKYPTNLDGPSFVAAVLATIRTDSGVDLSSERGALMTLFNSGGRAAVMYRLADDNAQTNTIRNRAFIDAEYNRAFVFTQYAGYLRRNADVAGFLFWLGQVNGAPVRNVPTQHAMVCAFITAAEYQQRFGSVVTRSNGECSQ